MAIHTIVRCFGGAEESIDVALTATLVFDDIIIPAVDAPFPAEGWKGEGRLPQLNLTAKWDPVHEAQSIKESNKDDLYNDKNLQSLLNHVPEPDRDIELNYAIADVIFMINYGGPIFCSPGRQGIISRLVEMEIFASNYSSSQLDVARGGTVREGLEEYRSIYGISLKRDSVDTIGSLKEDSSIEGYAKSFRAVLEGLTGDEGDLADALDKALKETRVRAGAKGLFSAVARFCSWLGMIPLLAPAASLAIGADETARVADRAASKTRWYEFSSEIVRFQSEQAMHEYVRNRKQSDMDALFEQGNLK